jgi:polygalacturonase
MANRRIFMQGAGALAVTLPLNRRAHAGTDTREAWERAADIARNVKPPTFPDRLFDITNYGALPDGKTLASNAIAQAIEACLKAGGGRVHVPAGTFLSGAIHLLSNVELHVSEGATLRFDTNPASYPVVFTRWEGMECMNYSPLIYARRQKNIAITGKGTLDGQGSERHWWSWKGRWGGTTQYGWKEGMPNQLPARAKLFQMAEAGVPVEKRVFGEGSYLRPPFIQP